MASGINAQSVAQEFLQHANEEQGHADAGASLRARDRWENRMPEGRKPAQEALASRERATTCRVAGARSNA